MPSSRPAPRGFRYLSSAEVTARRLDPRAGRSGYWLSCLDCGRVIIGSGLGIGSHRRGCPGKSPEQHAEEAAAEEARRAAVVQRMRQELTPAEAYQCQRCGMVFSTAAAWRAHRDEYHSPAAEQKMQQQVDGRNWLPAQQPLPLSPADPGWVARSADQWLRACRAERLGISPTQLAAQEAAGPSRGETL